MKRNTDRIYYDKGYKDGTKDTKQDGRIPKLIGAGSLLAIAAFDIWTAVAFYLMYAVFELTEYRDTQNYHESDPPPQWEDM